MFDFLFKPISSTSLALFRIVFGVLGFLDVLNIYVYYHLMVDAFDPEKFQFAYIGFEWVQVFSEPFMSLFFFLLMLSCIGIIWGYRYRLSSIFFAIGFTYLFLIEKSHYLNHGYLFCWICWVMAIFPATAQLALDIKRKPGLFQPTIPNWPIFVLRFLMGTVYFFGGIAKVNTDWLNGMPLKVWLPRETDALIVGPLLKYELMAYFMSYGGLFFDLMITFLLISKRTRTIAFVLALFFHGLNALIFNIGIFPYLSIALTALFFPPELFDRLVKRRGDSLEPIQHENNDPNRSLVTTFVVGLTILHIFLPLRHHLFPGKVAWTEEGHRYSWRMMLRSKSGHGIFIVENKQTGAKTRVDPVDFLKSKQINKLYTHPDMIWQFAQYLKTTFEKEGQEVAVYADIKVRLNNRKFQQFIDPGIDLAKEKWHFYRPSTWIIPMENK